MTRSIYWIHILEIDVQIFRNGFQWEKAAIVQVT